MGISEIHAGWFFVVLLLTAIVESTSDCLTQRCLATNLVNLINNRLVQPSEDCKIDVFLKEIVFETLEMNTQTLQLSSILKIQMVWVDPYLSWDSTYPYDQIVLPVSNVWTPSLSVKNALRVDKQPASSDLLVFRNGTVSYKLLMWITVGCDLNLYLYPFAKDKCLIALDGWNELPECGERVTFGQIMLAGKSRGDWQVESVIKEDLRDTVLMVCMSSKSINVLMTLIVPSLLIMLADIMCFFLPLGGEGERISFRVTLVLSFVMFLLILSGILPGNRQCTPLIPLLGAANSGTNIQKTAKPIRKLKVWFLSCYALLLCKMLRFDRYRGLLSTLMIRWRKNRTLKRMSALLTWWTSATFWLISALF
ncbi:5-hydroxytryptamine receptor 3A isoform X3 [Amia ocellicauda]|uniref:5-hydroxytryptamine receptor 3A isoform X3 n=1 Tax=Amia ocellicauda TaxID=2972642 RepID=UPI003463CA82